MPRQNYVFTSESVSEGHPDTLCDQISDAVLDALLKEEFDSMGINRHSLAVEVWRVYERCAAAKPVLEWDSNLREYVERGQWQFDAKGCLKALAMLHDMVERMDAREDADDGADDYETMLTGGSREF